MTAISENDLKTFFQALEDHPLEANNPFYEPYLEENDDPIMELQRKIRLNPEESVSWLSGLRGNGKSTELRRLRSLLEQQGYTVFLCDMEPYLNQHAQVEITDFLAAVILALSEQVKAEYGKDFVRESVPERLSSFLRTEVKLTALGTDGIISAQFLRDYGFKRNLQEASKNCVDHLVRKVHDLVKEIRQLISGRSPQSPPPVLLIDSVEKIRGIGTDAQLVYESVENLFKRYGDKLQFEQWHIVYTVPPYVTSLNLGGGGNTLRLPSIHIFTRDGDLDGRGITTMENIVNRRFATWATFFSKSQMQQLIMATGGDFRDFFRLIRSILLKIPVKSGMLQVPVADKLIMQAKSDLLNDMLPIPEDEKEWLRRIATSKGDELPTRGDLPKLVRFLDNNLVLTYRNGDSWYDIHPLLKEMLK